MAGAASQAGDADSSRAPGLAFGFHRFINAHRGTLLLVPQWLVHQLFHILLKAANTWSRKDFFKVINLNFH